MSYVRRFILSAAVAISGLSISAGTASAQECFIGEIRMFGGNFAPRNWALAEGQLMAINSNSALFSILGTTFGGDGRTTFALPDLRGRSAMGAGTGPGLTNRRIGQKLGSETNTLTTNQLPSHNHSATTTATLNAAGANGASPMASGNVLANSGSARIYASPPPNPAVTMAPDAISASTTVGNTGGGQAVNNMQPNLVVNHIICLQGVYPSRN